MNLDRLTTIALKEAEKSEHRYKHGAVLFRQGKPISKGHNQTNRGHNAAKGYWAGSLHAEIASLINARTDTRGASILVVRRNLRNSLPCSNCFAALKAEGIKSIFYSDNGVINETRI